MSRKSFRVQQLCFFGILQHLKKKKKEFEKTKSSGQSSFMQIHKLMIKYQDMEHYS